jgi:hypothetical protein
MGQFYAESFVLGQIQDKTLILVQRRATISMLDQFRS